MKIAACRLFRYRLPLVEALVLSGQPVSERAGLLLRVEAECGATGWGDIAPLPSFSRESIEDAEAQALALARCLPGSEFDIRSDERDAWPGYAATWSPSVRFGLETALSSLSSAIARGTVSSLSCFDGALPVSALLAGSRERVLADARYLLEAGCRALKLKVGLRSLSDDVDLVRTLRDVLGGKAALRLDANRKWRLEEAVTFARALGAEGIEYLEEPLRDPSRLGDFREAAGVPVALDESLLDIQPDELEGCGALGAVVLKPTLLGGISKTREWIAHARKLNVRPVLSACFESGVGILAIAALAFRETGGAVPAGLDTCRWLGADVVRPRIPVRGGTFRWSASLARRHRIDTGRLHEIGHG